jgi:hypothetical protein
MTKFSQDVCSQNPAASRWKFAGFYAVSMIAGTALTFQIYAMTRSRPAEFAIALLVVAPVVMFAMYKGSSLASPLTAYEAGVVRATAWLFVLSIPIFTLNLVLNLIEREQIGNLELGRNWLIAGSFIIIPIQAFSAYLLRQRWRKARATSPPPVRSATNVKV